MGGAVQPEQKQWCWTPDEYTVYGPFDSREDAIADAECYGDLKVAHVGRVQLLRPEDFVDDDMGYLLERMDERGFDEVGVDTDEYFYVMDEVAAQEALSSAVKQWARQFVQCSVWVMSSDTEEVEINNEAVIESGQAED